MPQDQFKKNILITLLILTLFSSVGLFAYNYFLGSRSPKPSTQAQNPIQISEDSPSKNLISSAKSKLIRQQNISKSSETTGDDFEVRLGERSFSSNSKAVFGSISSFSSSISSIPKQSNPKTVLLSYSSAALEKDKTTLQKFQPNSSSTFPNASEIESKLSEVCKSEVKVEADPILNQKKLDVIANECKFWLEPLIDIKLAKILIIDKQASKDAPIAVYNPDTQSIAINLNRAMVGSLSDKSPQNKLSAVFVHEIAHFLTNKYFFGAQNIQKNEEFFLYELSREIIGNEDFAILKKRCFGINDYNSIPQVDNKTRSILNSIGLREYGFLKFKSKDIDSGKISQIAGSYERLISLEIQIKAFSSQINSITTSDIITKSKNDSSKSNEYNTLIAELQKIQKQYTEASQEYQILLQEIPKYEEICSKAFWSLGNELFGVAAETLTFGETELKDQFRTNSDSKQIQQLDIAKLRRMQNVVYSYLAKFSNNQEFLSETKKTARIELNKQ